MKKVIILGCGGHAHVIADIVRANGDELVGYLDDNLDCVERMGPITDYEKYRDSFFVIGIGSSDVREKLSTLKVKWYTAIHPTAVISGNVKVAEGSVIMPNVVVNTRSEIGKHCILNTGAIIEHDNTIEDFVHVSVGVRLGGTVVIGKSTWIGIGATVINNVSVCSNCLVGAGSVVVKDIKESGTYFGVPARKIK